MVGYIDDDNNNFIGPGTLNKIAENNQNQRKETRHPLFFNENKVIIDYEKPVKEKTENKTVIPENKVQPENKNVSTQATPGSQKPFLSNAPAKVEKAETGYRVPVIISVVLILSVVAIFWISKAYKNVQKS